jgi:hypothetical protein
MGKHGNAFKFKHVKAVNTIVNPSVDMDGTKSKTIVTYDYLPGGIINYSEGEFPPNPDKNEICIVGGVFYIYETRGSILDWYPIGGGGGGDIVAASNVIEDNSHRFVTENQLVAITELEQGQIPAPKIIEDPDHNFVNNTQVQAINNLIDGIEIDGGDLD